MIWTAYTEQDKIAQVKNNRTRKLRIIDRNFLIVIRTVSKQHRITALKVTAEFINHLKTLLLLKPFAENFYNTSINEKIATRIKRHQTRLRQQITEKQ